MVLLIIPCYNEASRLPVDDYIKDTPLNCHMLFANDGSKDQTGVMLENLCRKREGFFVYQAISNKGKAHVIHDAFIFAKESGLLKNYEWVGFWDADLATPLFEISNFLNYQKMFSTESKALIGCRLNRYGAKVERAALRHYISRIFVTVTDLVLGVKAYDSQCGAKIFHQDIAEIALGKDFISKWVFDLEIILRVGANTVLEIPVMQWKDIPGSKVKIFREIFRVAKDLLAIKKQYKIH